jgi:uncharacterized phage-like protein YoqJ
MNIAISGSRKDFPRQRVELILFSFLGEKHHWILGGAMGVDQYALEYLMKNGEDFEVIVPFTIADTPVADKVRETLKEIPQKVTELNQTNKPPWYPKYNYRNKCMIDKADYLIAFPAHPKGGTRNAIQLAVTKRIPVQIVQP